MTLVSSKKFRTNEDKHFDLALNDEVCIRRGDYMYHLVSTPVEEQYPPQPFLEPDDDLCRAISADEFRKRALDVVEKVHFKFYPTVLNVPKNNHPMLKTFFKKIALQKI